MNAHDPIKLKPDTEVAGALSRHGTPIHVEVDSGYGDTLWYYANENGARMILVNCGTFEDALDCAYDVLKPIPAAEEHEAYGFNTREEYIEAVDRAQSGAGDWPDLADGYYYQSNATGTGIVFPGYSEELHEITPEWLKSAGVKLQIQRIY